MGRRLTYKLKDECVKLLITVAPDDANAFVHRGAQAPVDVCAALPMDGPMIWCKPFLEQSEGHARAHLVALFSDLAASGT